MAWRAYCHKIAQIVRRFPIISKFTSCYDVMNVKHFRYLFTINAFTLVSDNRECTLNLPIWSIVNRTAHPHRLTVAVLGTVHARPRNIVLKLLSTLRTDSIHSSGLCSTIARTELRLAILRKLKVFSTSWTCFDCIVVWVSRTSSAALARTKSPTSTILAYNLFTARVTF